MYVQKIISDHYSELDSIATNLGIDFSDCYRNISGNDDWQYVTPLDQKKDKQKVRLASTIKGNTLIVSFHTHKNGGQTAVWKHTEKEGSQIKQDRFSKRRAEERERKARFKEEKIKQLREKYIADYKACENWVTTSPYLVDKGLAGKVRVKKMNDHHGDFIAIPMIDQKGEISALERIYDKKPEGMQRKLSTPGGREKGSSFLIGSIKEEMDSIYICEGYADAVTVHLATGCPVYCAFGASNIFHVIQALLKKHPPKKIVLAADNDTGNPENGNPGRRLALEASYRFNVKARTPIFDGYEVEGEDLSQKDFNDLMVMADLKAVKEQLKDERCDSIVRSPRRAFKHHVNLLRYQGSKNYKKQLEQVIRTGINDSMNVEEVLSAIEHIDFISKSEVEKTYKQKTKGHAFRSKLLHKFSRKHSKPEVKTIPLNLKRMPHGGYEIGDDCYDQLKKLEGIVIVKAPMGSGKTEKLIKKWMTESRTGAYLAHRVALVEEACNRLNILSYKDSCQYDILGSGKIGVCVNSLNAPKFQRGAWFSDVDTVFIDEGSKVLDHLCGPTIVDPEAVTETFAGMLEVSKQIVICDADASNNLVNMLSDLAPERQITVVQPLSAPMDHIKVNLTSCFEAGYERVLVGALEGKKLLVAVDTKSEVKVIERKLSKKGISILGVHSGSRIKPEVEAWIKNPNVESKKYQVVVYNSCVDSGVSLTTPHFDETIGLFKGVVSPDTIMQMMGRNRLAREWFLAVNPYQKTTYGLDEHQMHRALVASGCKVLWEDTKQKIVEAPNLTDYDRLKIAVTRRNTLIRQDFKLTTKMMLEQDGYQVTCMTPPEDLKKSFEKVMRQEAKAIREEWIVAITDSDVLDSEEYRKLKRASVISEEDLAKVIKHEIEETFCMTKIDVADVMFWLDGGRRKIMLLEAALADDAKLLDFDRNDLKKTSSLALRKHLIVKGGYIKKMFEYLGLDIETGKGEFTHKHARDFLEWLFETDPRKLTWNYHRLGGMLFKEIPPDATKYIKDVLGKVGLCTERHLRTQKRTSHHNLDENVWKMVFGYIKKRREHNKNVADFTAVEIADEFSSEIEVEHTEDNEVFSEVIEPGFQSETNKLCIDCGVDITGFDGLDYKCFECEYVNDLE